MNDTRTIRFVIDHSNLIQSSYDKSVLTVITVKLASTTIPRPVPTAHEFVSSEFYPRRKALALLNAGGLLMSRQVALAGEATIADLTDVRPLPRVSSPVDGQGGSLRERLRTLIALVRFLAGVHPPVHSEILGIGESLAADIADVRFLAGVDAPVLLEMLGAAEALAAVVTEVQFCGIVALLMAKQGPFRG